MGRSVVLKAVVMQGAGNCDTDGWRGHGWEP